MRRGDDRLAQRPCPLVMTWLMPCLARGASVWNLCFWNIVSCQGSPFEIKLKYYRKCVTTLRIAQSKRVILAYVVRQLSNQFLKGWLLSMTLDTQHHAYPANKWGLDFGSREHCCVHARLDNFVAACYFSSQSHRDVQSLTGFDTFEAVAAIMTEAMAQSKRYNVKAGRPYCHPNQSFLNIR